MRSPAPVDADESCVAQLDQEDRRVGAKLGDLCSELAGLKRDAERALGEWVAADPLAGDSRAVAADALADTLAKVRAARQALRWVRQAVEEGAPTAPRAASPRALSED